MCIRKFALPFLTLLSSLGAAGSDQASFPPPDSLSLHVLYSSLDPLSLTEHLAFYDLYPDTSEGKLALEQAWKMLRRVVPIEEPLSDLLLPDLDLQPIISLITRQPHDPPALLSERQLALIHSLCRHLPNRKLRGANCCSREEVLTLPLEEVDLTRALLLYQFDESEQGWNNLRQYEASLDLLALQIAIRLPENATPEEKIHEINRMIFLEMQFKFPPPLPLRKRYRPLHLPSLGFGCETRGVPWGIDPLPLPRAAARPAPRIPRPSATSTSATGMERESSTSRQLLGGSIYPRRPTSESIPAPSQKGRFGK